MSECVRVLSYDEDNEELVVEFQKRGTYKYEQVPIEEYEAFNSSPSLGKYFNFNIRGKYSYERIG